MPLLTGMIMPHEVSHSTDWTRQLPYTSCTMHAHVCVHGCQHMQVRAACQSGMYDIVPACLPDWSPLFQSHSVSVTQP
jgi:hypothetical protein